MSGTPVATGRDGEPPLTNRGVVRPDKRESGGVDYLSLTVWATPEEVMPVLESGVLDRYGWSTDPMSDQDNWVELPGGKRAGRVFDSGSLQVIQFTEEVLQGKVFCSVEVKGATCAHLGNEGIRLLMDDMVRHFDIRASRVDVMAHTEAFKPADVRGAVKRGDYNSRSVTKEKLVYIESEAGNTCYLGMMSKPRGGLKRAGERVLRIYDRRGPTRVELQLTGGYAHNAGELLLTDPIEDWPRLIRGLIRHYCDFVDGAADDRPSRCPLLPWWKGFVLEAEKISVTPEAHESRTTLIGQVDGIFQLHARKLYAAAEAFGTEWILQRIQHHGVRRSGDDHSALVAELSRYKGTRLAGVPDDDDEPPI